jgi:DEAD/DEAH box helicase domain-containing protein
MPAGYFTSLVQQLRERSARATISQVAPSHDALRAFLLELLGREAGAKGSFLSQPVFEALFEYERDDQSLESLGLLHPRLIEQLDRPPEQHRERAFPKSIRPYVHQVAAWRALKETPARSVIISTGTASGKTECFVIPILDDLVREFVATNAPLVGVRALFLYPLNALINSQQERLAAWTAGLRGKVRFCLYNGATPDAVPQPKQDAQPEEVLARKTLRALPPPILVTNATMLEYMLVRREDARILQLSQGLLRWIVLDEAHTYLGSNAAEISLLLRRVMHAFGADPAEVRFVATSATIGTADDKAALEKYLADLAGVPVERVLAIGGRRVTPALSIDHEQDAQPIPTREELDSLEHYEARRDRLARVPEIRQLRHELTKGPMQLDAIRTKLFASETSDDALWLLDACSEAPPDGPEKPQPLLPLRGNLFMRAQAGVWACWNPACSGRRSTPLDVPSWPFGAVFLEHRQICSECGSLVFEVMSCSKCGEVYLTAAEGVGNRLEPVVRDAEFGNDAPEGEEESDEDTDLLPTGGRVRQLLCSREPNDWTYVPTRYDCTTGELASEGADVDVVFARCDDDGRLRCAGCGEREPAAQDLFRPVRLGAPFYLGVAIPAMLEHAPPHAAQRGQPFEGRQMITFSDTRQGTASFAMRAQMEAERNFVRSFIYHKLWSRVGTVDPTKVDEQRKITAGLEAVVQQNPTLQSVLDEAKQKLARLEAAVASPVASISWTELLADLANDRIVREHIRDAARLRYLPLSELTAEDFAKLFLFREFVRRPRRQNSLETLGLVAVCYPPLDDLSSAPFEWTNQGLTLAEWSDFLKICIDFFLRSITAVDVPIKYLRWMGTRIVPRYVVGPDSPTRSRSCSAWPAIRPKRRLPRLARLLSTAMSLNLEDADDKSLIDRLLRRAWADIQTIGLLEQSDDGFRLKLERTSLRIVTTAWKCSVTRRLLDTVLCDYSPYEIRRGTERPIPATPVKMPHLKYPFRREQGVDVPLEVIREWLNRDEAAVAARGLGVWTELSDRLAEGTAYMEVAEHSGQLGKNRLRDLEKRFRTGQTNLLSCSTTMEMGIDIGGLTTIAMNNAPPGPANWLQRAGRAGRRDVSRASTLTLCQTQPHAEAVFCNPLWPFTTPVHVPRVSLDSHRIVQRHVQAIALGRFLGAGQRENALRLSCEWFFRPPNAADRPLCHEFIAWLQDEAQQDSDLCRGVERVIARSTLEAMPLAHLMETAASAIEEIADRWTAEHEALVEQLEHVGGETAAGERNVSPEQRAVQSQLRRLRDEYLLTELAGSGFLPLHGFPMNVLPFVNTTVEQIIAQQKDEESREDAGFRRREYPARQLPLAIREYAPGNEVVIDGLVYTSGGLTLHWHVPPGDEGFRETQIIRWAWRCCQCGDARTSPVKIDECPACNSKRLESHLYLHPSGFAVDIHDRPENIISERTFIPPRAPWISNHGTWTPLPNPSLGQFRYDPDGQVFHFSDGKDGYGYAVCLRCGRAQSETGEARSGAETFGTHIRLRTGRKKDHTDACPGGEGQFTIKRNLWLGGRELTDVFELKLRHPRLGMLPMSRQVAIPLAVALRSALARKLGIQARELGWAISPPLNDGPQGTAIILYDGVAGGAGYVANAGDCLTELLSNARDLLSCPRACDTACHACLLDYDTQHYASELNRHAALDWLDDDFMSALQLPERFQCFGPSTASDARSITHALLAEFQQPTMSAVRVFLQGPPEAWDLDEWQLWRHLIKLGLSRTGVEITLILPKPLRAELPWSMLHALTSRAEAVSVKLLEVEGNDLQVGLGWRCVEVATSVSHTRWATFVPGALAPGPSWGRGTTGSPLVRRRDDAPLPDLAGNPIRLATVDALKPNTCSVFYLDGQLNGNVSVIGRTFWRELSQVSPLVAELLQQGSPKRVEYVDRYLRSPLPARVLFELLKVIRGTPVEGASQPSLRITTTETEGDRPGRWLYQDWDAPNVQADTLKALFSPLFLTDVKVLRAADVGRVW